MNTPARPTVHEDDLLLTQAISAHALRVATKALELAALSGADVSELPALLPARVNFDRDEHGRVRSVAIQSAGALLMVHAERDADGTLTAADFDFDAAPTRAS